MHHAYHFGTLFVDGRGIEVVHGDIGIGTNGMRHGARILRKLGHTQSLYIVDSLDRLRSHISAEELVATNPDIILLADALYGITPESVAERPGWDIITAVVNGAIYPIDPNMMSVPGPRLVDALEETAKILHPEIDS